MKPNNASKCEALIREAHQQHQQGAFDQAEATCRKVQKLQPLNFNALQILGAIALERRNYRQAVKFLAAASDIHRDIPGLIVNLGLAYKHNRQFQQAKKSFQRAIELDRDFGPAYYNLAVIMADENDLPSSYSLLCESERCRSDHVPTLELLANVLMRLGFSSEAADIYQRLLQSGTPTADLYFSLGFTHQSNKNYLGAAEAYTKAIELAPERIDIRAKLSEVLESMNRVDEARSHAESILALEQSHPVANLVISRIERRSGNLAAARDRLQAVPLFTPHTDADAAVLTELGMTLDRLGEYREAFDAFDRANGIMATLPEAVAGDPVSALQLVVRCKKELENSGGHAISINDELGTPVFLVGFPRSGTTLTEQILASHSNVTTTDELPVLHNMAISLGAILGRELEYPTCLKDLTSGDIHQLREHYWNQVTEAAGETIQGKLLVDKMPLNIIHLGLIERIFPGAKIIVALRDPRDVCLSCFMQLFSLNESMLQFLSLERTADYYAAVMGLWLGSREKLSLPWMESRYEDIVADAEAATRALDGFLGLATGDDQIRFYEKAAKRTISTPSYQDVSTPVYDRARGRWKYYSAQMQPILGTLEPYVKAFGYNVAEPD